MAVPGLTCLTHLWPCVILLPQFVQFSSWFAQRRRNALGMISGLGRRRIVHPILRRFRGCNACWMRHAAACAAGERSPGRGRRRAADLSPPQREHTPRVARLPRPRGTRRCSWSAPRAAPPGRRPRSGPSFRRWDRHVGVERARQRGLAAPRRLRGSCACGVARAHTGRPGGEGAYREGSGVVCVCLGVMRHDPQTWLTPHAFTCGGPAR